MNFSRISSKNLFRILKINLIVAVLLILLWPIVKYFEEFKLLVKIPSKSPTESEFISVHRNESPSNQRHVLERYYVYTSQCKIPAVDPFSSESIGEYEKLKEIDCTKNTKSLVTSHFNINLGQYILHINYDVGRELIRSTSGRRQDVTTSDVRCCYKEIIRVISKTGTSSDDTVAVRSCVDFDQNFLVPVHFLGVIVQCYDEFNYTNIIQEDGFSFIQKSKKPVLTKIGRRRPSILILGIDSLSKINFRRTMPKTFKYLEGSEWIELKGYNKIGDNTFPNLMAFLAGLNEESGTQLCKPSQRGGLDNCTFIWDYFKRAGYATAYAEDQCSLSTFNYLKTGFEKPPVDHYFRPVGCAFENHLKTYQFIGLLNFCVGRRQMADVIFNYCSELAQRYSGDDESIFGLCWSNTFSHSDYRGSSLYDDKMREYLRTLAETGVLAKNIVIFMSDHGMRWGSLMDYPAGYMEERLPILFVWVPQWFRTVYPQLYKNLKANQNRLSSPYDLHMTFRHILKLVTAGNTEPLLIPPAFECPHCQSLLLPISENRTCINAGIDDHWCICYSYLGFKDSKFTERVANLIIHKMNQFLNSANLNGICSKLLLKRVLLTERKIENDQHNISSIMEHNNGLHSYRFKFEAVGGLFSAIFQTTFQYDNSLDRIDINVEKISRFSSYQNSSKCINERRFKNVCFCRNASTTTTTKL